MQDNFNEDITQQAMYSFKQYVSKTGSLVSRGVKTAGKGFFRSFGKSAFRLLASLGQVGWIIGVFLLIIFFILLFIGASFDFMLDERGSSSALTLNPDYANPTVAINGVNTAVALTESQALIDAYYKYKLIFH